MCIASLLCSQPFTFRHSTMTGLLPASDSYKAYLVSRSNCHNNVKYPFGTQTKYLLWIQYSNVGAIDILFICKGFQDRWTRHGHNRIISLWPGTKGGHRARPVTMARDASSRLLATALRGTFITIYSSRGLLYQTPKSDNSISINTRCWISSRVSDLVSVLIIALWKLLNTYRTNEAEESRMNVLLYYHKNCIK